MLDEAEWIPEIFFFKGEIQSRVQNENNDYTMLYMFKTVVQSHIFIFNPNDLVKRQNYNNKKHLKKMTQC